MSWSATGEPRGPLEIGVVIGVVTLVAGIAFALIFLNRPAREPVALIGDSITLLSGGELRAELGSDYAVKIDATSGKRIDEQLGAAAAAVNRKNEQVIINLGTNDVMQGDADLDTSIVALEEMVGMFHDARCIHLVTVSDEITNDSVETRLVPARARRINDAIRKLAAVDPRIAVIDWNARVHEMGVDNLTDDTVHPSDEGKQVLVDDYKAALEACPDASS